MGIFDFLRKPTPETSKPSDPSPTEAPPHAASNPDVDAFIRGMQMEALARVAFLLSHNDPSSAFSPDKLVTTLARAEREAQFMCGFQLLATEPGRVQLHAAIAEMKKQGLVDVKIDGTLSLTPQGRELGMNTPLPDEIESCLPSV